ncbi:hypothetical protein BN2475_420022 [Paraburkholderia ribeironis]|uniref:Uncharacterized protein n=2 Tax=Paraburkholderia ribeironis TaxID=1247936 RepID=A0A1N7S7F5_9BURK|nr:hypothetical protein BN2475_420022 [Paraburkholderia ribeironis]
MREFDQETSHSVCARETSKRKRTSESSADTASARPGRERRATAAQSGAMASVGTGKDGVSFESVVVSPNAVLEMQRTLGNRFVQSVVQTKVEGSRSFVNRAPGGSVHVQRDEAKDLSDLADAGEWAAIEDQKRNLNQVPATQVSNVNDVSAAQTLAGKIEEWRPAMEQGAKAGGAFVVSSQRVTPEKMRANETAISQLNDYLVTAGEQSRTLDSFQDGLRKAQINYARLKAQVNHLTVSNVVSRDATAGQIGEQIVQASGFADTDAAQDAMKKLERDTGFLGVHNQAQDAHTEMVKSGQAVGSTQSKVSQAAYAYNAALNTFEGGIPPVEDNPEQAKALSDLKGKIEKIKKYVGKGLEYAGKGLEKLGVEGAEKVGGAAGPVVDWITDQVYDAELNGLQSQIAKYNQAYTEHKVSGELDEVRKASRAFTEAIANFNNAVNQYGENQRIFRDKLSKLAGAAAGKGAGGGRFAMIATVLPEVDSYEDQLDTTLRLGYQEQAAAAEAAASRRSLEGGPKEGGGRDAGLPYYEPYMFHHNNGGWNYECQRNELRIASLGTSRGSAAGVANIGVNETIDEAIRTLQTLRAEVDPMRKALAKAMDIRMDTGMPTSAGGVAPTSRSANTGL